MTTHNPVGRANYEPNSFGPAGGPREDPVHGFQSFVTAESGNKRRLRAESFADHYSQARQFYRSQTPLEQDHVADALVFELSKVLIPAIRERVVAGLVNIDTRLASAVADGLGLDAVPTRLTPAIEPRDDLEPSPALSMLTNPPGTFEGRRVGAIVTNGTDAKALIALRRALSAAKADLVLVAPTVMGVADSEGNPLLIDEKLDGGPSVLFDAVALLPAADAVASLQRQPAMRDFLSDAHAHCKFIGFNDASVALLDSAGLTERDGGFARIDGTPKAAKAFVTACTELRYWARAEGA